MARYFWVGAGHFSTFVCAVNIGLGGFFLLSGAWAQAGLQGIGAASAFYSAWRCLQYAEGA